MLYNSSGKNFLAAAIVCLTAASSWGQNIEELQRQYEKEMKIMQEAFQEQLNALKTQQESILEAIAASQVTGEPADDLAERVAVLEESTQQAENDFRVYWKEGLRFDSNDGAFKLKLGGRIQNDYAWWSVGDELEATGFESDGGTEFRRARIYIGGTIYDNFEFKAQYDFAGGDADFKDVWMATKNVPIAGQIKIGHFKEPMGLEVLTSSKDTTFMERALPAVLTSERSTGIAMARNFRNKRMGVSAGAFYETDGFGDGDENGHNFTGRIHGRPWVNEEGDRYVHLGGSASYRSFDNTLRIRQRPEVHMADRYTNTNSFAADDAMVYGLESALVYGPASIQGEFLYTDINRPSSGLARGALPLSDSSDVNFGGYYIQASYFLTGEHRRYKEGPGIFDKIKPINDFKGFGKGGIGAWELAARYSQLDLDNGAIRGGEEGNFTLGVNWYLNPNMKIMLNYVHGDIDRDEDASDLDDIVPAYDDDFDALMARFQVTW